MNIKSLNMKTQEISALLDKYYRGETSDDEETLLKEFFRDASVPSELENEKEIFNFYNREREATGPSPGFESRIIDAIDEIEKNKVFKYRRRILYSAISSAAALALFVGSYFFFIQKSDQVDTFTDPAVAYAETMKILMDVSVTLNKGRNALEPVARLSEMKEVSLAHLHKSSSIIQKTVSKLDYLDKISGYDSTGIEEKSNK